MIITLNRKANQKLGTKARKQMSPISTRAKSTKWPRDGKGRKKKGDHTGRLLSKRKMSESIL